MRLEQLSGETSQQSDSNPALRAVALGEMRGVSQIFDFAEFYSFVGNADAPKKPAAEAGGSERTINNDYAGVVGAPNYGMVTLQIFGDKVKTDLAYERRGGNVESERVRELQSFARGLGRYFMYQLINGTGVAPQMHGLKALIQAAQTLSLDGAGAAGKQVPLGNSDANKALQQAFIEKLNELIANVGQGGILIMNPKMISRLSAIAREYVQYTNINGVFGPVTMYNNVPIINPGYSKDLITPVLPQNEVVGANNDCCSIYAVRYGEKADTTIGTNVGLQVRDLGLVATQYTTLVEMDADQVILGATSAWRLQGIQLP